MNTSELIEVAEEAIKELAESGQRWPQDDDWFEPELCSKEMDFVKAFSPQVVLGLLSAAQATTCPGHGRSECVSCCWPKGELEGKLAEKMVFDEKSRIGELADLLAMARPHVPVTDPLRGLANANLMQHRLEQDPWADFKDAAPVPEGSSQIELAKTLISLSGDIRQPINPSQAAWMAAQLEELGYRKQVQP